MTSMSAMSTPFVATLSEFNPSGNYAALIVKLTREMMEHISTLYRRVHSGQTPLSPLPAAQWC
jgi:hypothetical protein